MFQLRSVFILLSALAFVVATFLAGPLRMYMSMVGLSPLIYIPNLMMLIAVVWQTLSEPHEKGFSALWLIALVLPLYGVAIGMQFVPVLQVAMGLYVLLPFWFGLACGPVILGNWRLVAKVLPWLWLMVVTGVLLNNFVEYPWEGFGYSLGDLDVEGSRQWYATGGGKRLAGFSRASFDAAVQIALLGMLLALQIRHPLMRMIVWSITFYAIIPTNSKGIMMMATLMTPIMLFRSSLPESLLRPLPALFGMLALALPVSTQLFVFDNQFSNPALANATFSFYDRLNRMWPEAWALLQEKGNLLLGRGIGGIGTGQTYFEQNLFNAGDNIFMYWFVVFGWLALPGFALLILRSLRIKPCQDPIQMRLYCMLLATVIYGSMTNIVENAVFALVCGIVIRWLCATPRNVANPYNQSITLHNSLVPATH